MFILACRQQLWLSNSMVVWLLGPIHVPALVDMSLIVLPINWLNCLVKSIAVAVVRPLTRKLLLMLSVTHWTIIGRFRLLLMMMIRHFSGDTRRSINQKIVYICIEIKLVKSHWLPRQRQKCATIATIIETHCWLASSLLVGTRNMVAKYSKYHWVVCCTTANTRLVDRVVRTSMVLFVNSTRIIWHKKNALNSWKNVSSKFFVLLDAPKA